MERDLNFKKASSNLIGREPKQGEAMLILRATVLLSNEAQLRSHY